ncbi:CDP-alcohol phosphatidyltransferase family protein [uncultured Cohaesibacter sp.]|uniref:CDP-alcohol phosphatidyltransferase family protein n=1 Tax=uncultured Cohaesibacter sp. TaxID=1002546 RepID=UPI0029C81D9C|nr:CDP-alcohol phosphatidyltransferase family protein [uncultured Cohaesibacter sp.]
MQKQTAFLVHLLTASGAAFALLATLAASNGDWTALFFWLLAAQFVDGIDGPIARKMHVSTVLPHWSGNSLDFVIDYATYVFIPAFAFVKADLMPEPYGLVAAAIIVVSGGLYFANDQMKAPSNAFRGFPAVWNGVLFYYFIFTPDPVTGFIVLVLLAAGQFIPIEFVHPVRVKSLRPLTLTFVAVWSVFACHVVFNNMVPTSMDRIALAISGLYLFAIGPLLHFRRIRPQG